MDRESTKDNALTADLADKSGNESISAAEQANEVHSEALNRLSQHGHKYTGGRRRLVQALLDANQPITLPEIVASDPGLTQSSTYRNLDVLESSQIIRRVIANGDHTHFELAEPIVDHHHHLICLDCGTICDVHLNEDLERLVEQELSSVAASRGFVPSHHSMDLHGLCPDCQVPETGSRPARVPPRPSGV